MIENIEAEYEMKLIRLRIEELNKEIKLISTKKAFYESRLQRLEDKYGSDIIEVL